MYAGLGRKCQTCDNRVTALSSTTAHVVSAAMVVMSQLSMHTMTMCSTPVIRSSGILFAGNMC